MKRTQPTLAVIFVPWILLLTVLPAQIGCNCACADSKPVPASVPSQSNCVDSCILEFSARLGQPVTSASLESAFTRAGLDPSAGFRSMADCQKILAILGIASELVPISIHDQTTYPPLSILYIPPPDERTPGHAVVVSAGAGQGLVLYDPASKTPRMTLPNRQVLRSYDTIALIPARGLIQRLTSEAGVPLLVSVLLGLGIAAPILLLRRRSPRAASLSGAVLVFGLGSLGGCTQRPNPPLIVLEEIHDFGVLQKSQGDMATHVFRILNNADYPLRISGTSQSCSCVVADVGARGIDVSPGETVEFPASVRLGSKLGAFEESVLLICTPPLNTSPILRMKGFVATKPQPDVESLVFRVAKGQAATRELKVVYPLQRDEASLEISRVTVEGTHAGLFAAQTPRREQTVLRTTHSADVWSLPVTFRHDPEHNGPARAVLRIHWDRPELEQTIDLQGLVLPAVEIPGGENWFVADLTANVEHTEVIPVRLHDINAARRLQIASSSENVSGRLDVEQRRLLLSMTIPKKGKFTIPVTVRDGQTPVLEVHVTGTAK